MNVKPPPRTDIPAIDQHYAQYDTQAHIADYNSAVEYERARDNITTFWRQMQTPQSEQDACQLYLADTAQVENMILYLRYCKRYYETERTLQNCAQQRQEVLEYLFRLSWTFDMH